MNGDDWINAFRIEVPRGTLEAYCSECDAHIPDHYVVVAARLPKVIADSLPAGKRIAHAVDGRWCGPVLVSWHGARWQFCHTHRQIIFEPIVLAEDGHRWIHWVEERACDDVDLIDPPS